MENILNNIQISNFKSIKKLDLNECSRINIFIGRPNVGKSNILEAIGVLGLSHVKFNADKKINNFIRIENGSELFFDGNINMTITIHTNILNAEISYEPNITFNRKPTMPRQGVFHDFGLHVNFTNKNESFGCYLIDEDLNLIDLEGNGNSLIVKKYSFVPNVKYKQVIAPFLIPPFGINLLNSIEINENLKSGLILLFKEYG